MRRLAILIDADNTSSRIAAGLFEEVAKFGEASVRRIYGDFSGQRLKSWVDILQRHAIDLTNPLIFDSNVNHEHLQEADVDSSFVAARAEPRKTETWPPTRGNDDTSPN